jgi:hypothetical protein
MHAAIEALGLEHLWVVYPGTRVAPLTEKISALPLAQVEQIQTQTHKGKINP